MVRVLKPNLNRLHNKYFIMEGESHPLKKLIEWQLLKLDSCKGLSLGCSGIKIYPLLLGDQWDI